MDKASGQISCTDCLKRSGCVRVCDKIEALLPKVRGGGHEREQGYNPSILEQMVNNKERGYKTKPIRYNNDCELE